MIYAELISLMICLPDLVELQTEVEHGMMMILPEQLFCSAISYLGLLHLAHITLLMLYLEVVHVEMILQQLP